MADGELAYLTPEARARVEIDRMLDAAGWTVQDASRANLHAARGVAVREFVLRSPHGRADYLLFVDGAAAGVIEAKKEGQTLTGVEWQSARYVDGLPDEVPTALEGALPFVGEFLDDIEAGKSFQCHGRPAMDDEWGVIKVSAMSWGSFDPDENKAVVSDDQVIPRWEIAEGDLLLSRANTTELVGATVLVGNTRPRLLMSDKSMRLLTRDDVDKAWLQLALSAPESRRQMSAVATGTKDSMRNISQEKVRAVRVRVPPLEEQRRIVAEVEARLSAIDALRAAIERAQRRSAALRRAVLERAFRGELVPQDPSDEPAEALLARIRAERAVSQPATGRRRKTVRP